MKDTTRGGCLKNEIAKNAHNLRGAEQKETRKVERFAQKFRVRRQSRASGSIFFALLPEVVKDAGSRSGQRRGFPIDRSVEIASI